MVSTLDEKKIDETHPQTPALTVTLKTPDDAESPRTEYDKPVPIILTTGSGKKLNDLLPEGVNIYYLEDKSRLSQYPEVKPTDIVITSSDLSDEQGAICIDEQHIEVVGRVLFDISIARMERGVELQLLEDTVYRNNITFWREHPELRETDSLMSSNVSAQYIEQANRYLGIYSSAAARSLAYLEESNKFLKEKVSIFYNDRLLQDFRYFAKGIDDLVLVAHAPNEKERVKLFYPRNGRYLDLPWKSWVMRKLSTDQVPQDQDYADQALPLEEGPEEKPDYLKERLTRIYEARFPDEPLRLEIVHTGNMVLFGGLEGEEVIITTSDGSARLNDFLPAGQKILDRHHPTEHFYYHAGTFPEDRHVVVDLAYVNNNKIPEKDAVTGLAHEIGHAYSSIERKWAIMSPSEFEKMEKELSDTKTPIPRDAAYRGISFYSISMENEVEAWNEGELVATACGIDSTTYEWDQERSLESHYYVYMDRVLALSQACREIIDSDEFDIYNPFSQDYSKRTLAEIRQIVDSLKFQSKAKTLYQTLDKIHPF